MISDIRNGIKNKKKKHYMDKIKHNFFDLDHWFFKVFYINLIYIYIMDNMDIFWKTTILIVILVMFNCTHL